MNQPPLDNQTDFRAHPQLLLTKDGERLVVVVKATFEFVPEARILELAPKERARGIRLADVPWEDPEVSSVLYPADLCPAKPATDVVVVAVAHAPSGQPVPSFDVLVQVGPLSRSVRVCGLRVWEAGATGISAPRPVSQVEMRYENAWGGFDGSDPARPVEEPRNPVGKGVCREPSLLMHQMAPCIEDPAFPILHARGRPEPVGIGAIGRHWEPRRSFLGTFDKVWEKTRAPLPPLDQDDRMHLCASPGLIASPPLRGGERVALLNLVPGGGATEFMLPRLGVEFEFLVKDREPEIQRPHLDTVLIDTLVMGAGLPLTVELVFRGSVKAPRRMLDAQTIIREVELG